MACTVIIVSTFVAVVCLTYVYTYNVVIGVKLYIFHPMLLFMG